MSAHSSTGEVRSGLVVEEILTQIPENPWCFPQKSSR
jgi:hypothetical protein